MHDIELTEEQRMIRDMARGGGGGAGSQCDRAKHNDKNHPPRTQH
ncbi:hypothetical protein QF018_005073, partial [Pseudomonas laurylsulfatiphila]